MSKEKIYHSSIFAFNMTWGSDYEVWFNSFGLVFVVVGFCMFCCWLTRSSFSCDFTIKNLKNGSFLIIQLVDVYSTVPISWLPAIFFKFKYQTKTKANEAFGLDDLDTCLVSMFYVLYFILLAFPFKSAFSPPYSRGIFLLLFYFCYRKIFQACQSQHWCFT